jgi:hypothetical protein
VLAVDAVQRHEVVDLQLALEPHEQAFLQVLAGGRDGEEGGLVGHHELLVLEQHLLLEGDVHFAVERAVVVDAQRRFVAALDGDGDAVLVDHVAGHDALQPCVARDGGKALDQELGDGRPGAVGQADAARAHAVAGGQRQPVGGHCAASC